MTPQHITLVQASFQHVLPVAHTAAALFFIQLFTLAPSLRRLFPGDLHAQGHELMTILAAIVQKLACPNELLPLLRQFGAWPRCDRVGAGPCALVGSTLLWTLHTCLR